jgi:hypothetical protein
MFKVVLNAARFWVTSGTKADVDVKRAISDKLRRIIVTLTVEMNE